MFGWCEKILRVDLSNGKPEKINLDAQAARDYVGGRGLGVYKALAIIWRKAVFAWPQNMAAPNFPYPAESKSSPATTRVGNKVWGWLTPLRPLVVSL